MFLEKQDVLSLNKNCRRRQIDYSEGLYLEQKNKKWENEKQQEELNEMLRKIRKLTESITSLEREIKIFEAKTEMNNKQSKLDLESLTEFKRQLGEEQKTLKLQKPEVMNFEVLKQLSLEYAQLRSDQQARLSFQMEKIRQ